MTGQIKGNPYNVINQAIVFYAFYSAIEEKDFELLKRIIAFLKEYDLITEGQELALRRNPSKRAAEVIRLARAQYAAHEALARERAQRAAEAARRAEREEEEYWNSPEVLSELAEAETAHLQRTSNPAQDLIVLAEPSPDLEPPIPANPSSRVRMSAEELALIVSLRRGLHAKRSDSLADLPRLARV